MTSHSRFLILAASLVAMPLAGALAQSNNPTGNYGSNQSMTASPGTADNKAASGMNTADVNATPPRVSSQAKSNYVPGATGRTVVPGSNSTMAGDVPSSTAAKTGATASDGGK